MRDRKENVSDLVLVVRYGVESHNTEGPARK